MHIHHVICEVSFGFDRLGAAVLAAEHPVICLIVFVQKILVVSHEIAAGTPEIMHGKNLNATFLLAKFRTQSPKYPLVAPHYQGSE